MPIVEEFWKSIPGYTGYEASSIGRIRSVDRVICKPHNTRFIAGRILRQNNQGKKSNSPYRTVYLGNTRTVRAHVAIALAFYGPCPKGMEVCHNNGDKLDNHPDNLRYDTKRNNILDRALHGTDNRGERHGMHKLSNEDVRSILSAALDLQKQLAERFAVSEATIRAILNQRRRLFQ